jgi:hypothetical protein
MAMNFQQGQDAFQSYLGSHAADPRDVAYDQQLALNQSRDSELGSGGGNQNAWNSWYNSLSPEDQASYNSSADANFSARSGRAKMGFGLALGAMGGLGALYGGAGGLGAGGAELAGASAETFPGLQMSTSLSSPGAYSTVPAWAEAGEPLALQASSSLSPSSLAAIGAGGEGPSFGSPEQRASDYAGGYGSTDGVKPAIPTGAGTNPYLDVIKQFALGGGSPAGNVSQGVRLGSNLLSMYDTYQNKRRNQGMADNLNSLYSQDSPYAQQLNKTLTRAYAASGRRSDIGGRNVELQAKLAEMNGRLAPTLNQINNQQAGYNNRFLYSGLQALDQSGLLDKGIRGLAGMFGG